MISSASSRVTPQRLGVLGAVALEAHEDLGRHLVVRGLEDLDDVVAPERDVDADQPPARLLDDPFALLHALAPRGQSAMPCEVHRISEM